MNTINNNISFGAKLDYSRFIGGNKARWTKIDEIFEEKTKQHPKDTFLVETNNKGGIYFHPKYSDNKLEKASSSYDKGEVSFETTNLLETFSAEKVADLLKRMFTMRRKSDNMLKDFFAFKKKYNINNLRGDAIDNFYILDVREIFAKDLLKKDKVLKDLNGIEIV